MERNKPPCIYFKKGIAVCNQYIFIHSMLTSESDSTTRSQRFGFNNSFKIECAERFFEIFFNDPVFIAKRKNKFLYTLAAQIIDNIIKKWPAGNRRHTFGKTGNSIA